MSFCKENGRKGEKGKRFRLPTISVRARKTKSFKHNNYFYFSKCLIFAGADTLTQITYYNLWILQQLFDPAIDSIRPTLLLVISRHSRPQRPRSFWSAPRIATSGQPPSFLKSDWLVKQRREIAIPGADQKDRALRGKRIISEKPSFSRRASRLLFVDYRCDWRFELGLN